jgi:hypothetical protein
MFRSPLPEKRFGKVQQMLWMFGGEKTGFYVAGVVYWRFLVILPKGEGKVVSVL